MESKEYVLEKMRDIGLQAAEAFQTEASELDETAIIDRENDIPDFNPDKHQYLNWTVGSCVRDDGQVWQLIQPYDSNTYKDHPNDMRAQWSLCHTKDPAKAKPFVPAVGTSGIYKRDEYCIDDGKVYRCIVDQTDHRPTAWPQGWEEAEI